MSQDDFRKAMDRASQELLADTPRGHLGASQIGGRCVRKAWYGFRWAYQEKHTGRIMRLFSRGHEEEFRFVRWLRAMGIEVQDYAQRLLYKLDTDTYGCMNWGVLPPGPGDNYIDVSQDRVHIERAAAQGSGPRQWGFAVDIGQAPEPRLDADGKPAPKGLGHYAGSSDGRLRGIEKWFPEVAGHGWGLLECKTSNDKSFKVVANKGVLTAKPEHYNQMQQYMHFLGLEWALYLMVNKNDDSIYDEVLWYRPEIAMPYAERAMNILAARTAPKRVTNDASWFECRWCAYREICHYDKEPHKNCRSCAYSVPVAAPDWCCHLYSMTIPKDFIPQGCDKWEPIK